MCSIPAKSFKTADDKIILLENPSKASSIADKKLNLSVELKKDPSDILQEFVNGKRKRAIELLPKKKARQASLNSSIVSPVKLDIDSDDDSIDWSGDEFEMNKNVSLLDQSLLSESTSSDCKHERADSL